MTDMVRRIAQNVETMPAHCTTRFFATFKEIDLGMSIVATPQHASVACVWICWKKQRMYMVWTLDVGDQEIKEWFVESVELTK